jgi:hypothetical protein
VAGEYRRLACTRGNPGADCFAYLDAAVRFYAAIERYRRVHAAPGFRFAGWKLRTRRFLAWPSHMMLGLLPIRVGARATMKVRRQKEKEEVGFDRPAAKTSFFLGKTLSHQDKTTKRLAETTKCFGETIKCFVRTTNCHDKTTRCLEETTKPFSETTKCFVRTTKCFNKTTKRLEETIKPFGETTKCLGETTKCFCETTKWFGKTTKPFGKTLKRFGESTKRQEETKVTFQRADKSLIAPKLFSTGCLCLSEAKSSIDGSLPFER